METFRVEIDGDEVGPVFDSDEQDAHVWVARRHPGRPYTIVTRRRGVPDFVVSYPPAQP
ncbi:MAG: hypothetical protein JWO37_2138 [Acidimicrobiales bacterium]|jgi:hypothetical protein|nr:hypothetical protein [Acidimicrobiales bacterium]